MLTITCPFCGPRAETEFTFGGPAAPKRPDAPQDMSDEDWVNYLTVVPNPMGPVRENWWHGKGCGTWLTVTRDTVTHDIIGQPETPS